MSEQTKLADVDTTPKLSRIPPRPEKDMGDILAAVARGLCKSMGFEALPEDMDLDDVEDEDKYGEYRDFLFILDNEYDWDGYRLARALDDKGWDIDARMVESLDSASILRHAALDRAEKTWVTKYELKPKYALQDKIYLMYDDPANKRKLKKGIGEVVEVRASNLSYIIQIPELGHGQPNASRNMTIHGFCVNEEKILGLVGETSNVPAV